MHHVQFTLVVLMWSTSFILMKYAGAVFGPMTISWGRCVGGAAVLVLLVAAMLRQWPWQGFRRRHSGAFAVIVPLGFAYPFAMQPYLITKHANSAFFGMMPAMVPLITIAMSVVMLNVRPTARQLIGVTAALGLSVLLAMDGVTRAEPIPVLDFLLGVSVPASYAISNTFIKRAVDDLPRATLTIAALGGTGLLLTPYVAVAELPSAAWGSPGLPVALASLAALGVFGTGLSILLFYNLIGTHGPLYAGMVTYLVPLGALFWGWLDGESITPLQVACFAGIVSMVVWVQAAAPRAAAESVPPAAEPGLEPEASKATGVVSATRRDRP